MWPLEQPKPAAIHTHTLHSDNQTTASQHPCSPPADPIRANARINKHLYISQQRHEVTRAFASRVHTNTPTTHPPPFRGATLFHASEHRRMAGEIQHQPSVCGQSVCVRAPRRPLSRAHEVKCMQASVSKYFWVACVHVWSIVVFCI